MSQPTIKTFEQKQLESLDTHQSLYDAQDKLNKARTSSVDHTALVEGNAKPVVKAATEVKK